MIFGGLHVGALLSEVSQNHSVSWNSKVDMMEDGGCNSDHRRAGSQPYAISLVNTLGGISISFQPPSVQIQHTSNAQCLTNSTAVNTHR